MIIEGQQKNFDKLYRRTKSIDIGVYLSDMECIQFGEKVYDI